MNFVPKIRLFVIIGMILLWAVSQAFAESPGNARGMATVDIKYSSLELIVKATEDVFTKAGFEIIESDDYSFVFERPGSRKKDIAYGGLEGGVIEQAVVDIEEKSPTLHWVRCDVYMVKGRGSDRWADEDKTKVMKAFGREYQKLLNKVKQIAEQKPMNVIKE
jgi:hypothetical protein